MKKLIFALLVVSLLALPNVSATWWNASLAYKRPIININGYPDAVLAGSRLLQINNNMIEVWCDPSAAWLYFNNNTGSDVYCVNAAEDAAVGTDLVNSTFPDTGNPWDSSALLILHMNGTDFHDSSVYHRQKVSISGTMTVSSSCGQVGSGVCFDDYSNVSFGDIDEFDNLDALTIYTHAKWASTPDVAFVTKKDPATGNAPWSLQRGGEGVNIYIMHSGGDSEAWKNTYATNNWWFITGSYGSTESPKTNLYRNGELADDDDAGSGNTISNSYEVMIGAVTGYHIGSYMDEVRFYNVSHNITVINETYWSQVAGFNFSYLGDLEALSDTDAPDLTFISPANNTIIDNATYVYVDVNGFETLSSCIIEINGTNYTATVSGGAHCIYNITNQINDTTLDYRMFANDTAGNVNTTAYWRTSFFYDRMPPQLTFILPTNNTVTQNESYVFVNVSAGELLYNCVLSTTIENFSMTVNGSHCYYNITRQINGTQLDYRVFGTDLVGNVNVTSWWRATINSSADFVKPQLYFISPSLNNTHVAKNNFIINVTSSEALSDCILQIDNMKKYDPANFSLQLTANYTDSILLFQTSSVRVSGDYAYTTSYGNSTLARIDVSNHSNPVLANYYTDDVTLNRAFGMDISGKYAYVAAIGSGDLVVFDISNTSISPVVAGIYSQGEPPFGPLDVMVSGKYAYVLSRELGTFAQHAKLMVLDVSNLSLITLISEYTVNDHSIRLFYQDGYVYISGYISGYMDIIDVTDPLNPTLANSYYAGDPQSVYVVGDYAYIGTWSSHIYIVNVSNKYSPILVKDYALNWSTIDVTDIVVSGDYLFGTASVSNVTFVMNISNATSPTMFAMYSNPELIGYGGYNGLGLYGDYLYLAAEGGNALSIYDVSKLLVQENLSMLVNNDSCYYSMTNQADGAQLDYKVFGTDLSNNVNATGWWRTTVNLSDSEGPVCSLISPFNTERTSDNTTTFTWSCIDQTAVDKMHMQIANNSAFTQILYESNLSVSTYTIAAPGLADNEDAFFYYWRVAANDTLGFMGNWTAAQTFVIDTVNPDIVWSNWSLINNTITGLSVQTLNNSVLNHWLNFTNLTVTNATNSIIYSNYTLMPPATTVAYIRDTITLNEGINSIKVCASDGLHLMCEAMNLELDTIPPVVSLQKPDNATYNETYNIPINYSASDLNLDKVWYTVFYANGTQLSGPVMLIGNATIAMPVAGQFYVTLYVNDSGSNIDSASRSFSIFDYSKTTMLVDGVANVNAYEELNVSMDVKSNGLLNYSMIGIPSGTYYVYNISGSLIASGAVSSDISFNAYESQSPYLLIYDSKVIEEMSTDMQTCLPGYTKYDQYCAHFVSTTTYWSYNWRTFLQVYDDVVDNYDVVYNVSRTRLTDWDIRSTVSYQLGGAAGSISYADDDPIAFTILGARSMTSGVKTFDINYGFGAGAIPGLGSSAAGAAAGEKPVRPTFSTNIPSDGLVFSMVDGESKIDQFVITNIVNYNLNTSIWVEEQQTGKWITFSVGNNKYERIDTILPEKSPVDPGYAYITYNVDVPSGFKLGSYDFVLYIDGEGYREMYPFTVNVQSRETLSLTGFFLSADYPRFIKPLKIGDIEITGIPMWFWMVITCVVAIVVFRSRQR
jgi:hypothetical protein